MAIEQQPVAVTQEQPGRSLGELFSQLSREMSVLVHEEVRLAKLEMSEKVKDVGRDVAMLAAAAILGLGGFLVFLAFLVSVLVAAGLSVWLSSLLVAIVVLAVAGSLAAQGYKGLKSTRLVPEQTIQTLKEDAQWAKQLIR